MMNDSAFISSDTAEAKHDIVYFFKAKHDIVQALYDRLNEVRRAINMKFPLDDEFELGINCRLANEAEWLEDLLEKIERS